MPRATHTALIILVAHAAFAVAQRGGLASRAAADSDAVFRNQAIALLQGRDTVPYLSEQRIALVTHALRSIHAQFPRVEGIVPDVDGSRMVVSIADSAVKTILARSGARKPAEVDPMVWQARVTHTGIPALDRLNTMYGVRRMVLFVADFGTDLYLEFARPVNIAVIRTAYQRVPQVRYATSRELDVYSWVALFIKGRTLDFAFARGGGDCPAGCTEWDYYYVAYDTVTRTATMEREKPKDQQWSEPISYWDVPSRLSINPYATFDSLLAGTRDSRWWCRTHAVQVLAMLLGPAIGPWRGAGEQSIERFTALKRSTLARQQEAYSAIVDRLTDPDPDVARVALANLRSVSRRRYTVDRAGLAEWQRWLRDVPNQRPPLEIRFINVGQGDAILIRQGSLAALVDAGLTDDSIMERLRALDVDSLQLFVASHNHDDHIGSAAVVLSALPVRLFIDNGTRVATPAWRSMRDALQQRGIPQLHAVRHTITLGDSRIEIIPPPAGVGTLQGNHSLSVRIERGAFRALLTGDGERSEIAALAAHERLGRVDVLKAPNHGDTTAVTNAWVRRLSPDVVVVSSADVYAIAAALQRYDSDKRTVLSTHYDGDIVVFVYDDGTYSVQSRAGTMR